MRRRPCAQRAARHSAPPSLCASSPIDFTAGARDARRSANDGSSRNRWSTDASSSDENASYVKSVHAVIDEIGNAAQPRTDDGDSVHEGFVDDERRVFGPQRRDDQHVQTAVDLGDMLARSNAPSNRTGSPAAARFSRAWYPGRRWGPRRSRPRSGPRRRRAASISTWAPLCQAIVPTKPIFTCAPGSIPRDHRRLRPEAVVRELDATLVQAKPDILLRKSAADGATNQIDFVEDLRAHVERRADNCSQGSRACIGSRRAAASASTGSKPAARSPLLADEAFLHRALCATAASHHLRAEVWRCRKAPAAAHPRRSRDRRATPRRGRAARRTHRPACSRAASQRSQSRAREPLAASRTRDSAGCVREAPAAAWHRARESTATSCGRMRRCPRSDSPPSY